MPPARQAEPKPTERPQATVMLSRVAHSLYWMSRQIERAETMIGAGRVKYIHPDCGFWMVKRSVADRKIEALVLGRDKYLGR